MNMKAEVLDRSPGRKEAWGEGCDTTRQLRASQYVMIRQFPVGDTVKVFWKWYLRWFWMEGRQFRKRAWEPLGDCEIWSRCCTSFCKSYNEKKDVNVKPFRVILPSCTIPSFKWDISYPFYGNADANPWAPRPFSLYFNKQLSQREHRSEIGGLKVFMVILAKPLILLVDSWR